MIIREGNLDEVKANFPPQAKSYRAFPPEGFVCHAIP